MEYRPLGNSGLKVSLIGLGTNVFGPHGTLGNYTDQKGAETILHRAADLGINLIDTADMYADGVSETYIGKAIAGRRDDFIIASKVGFQMGDGPNDEGLSRAHIMTSIEGSLRRLDTDYVDLYYAHTPDLSTPIEETVRAFDDLVRQGKTRYVGCSNYAGWQIADARCTAERLGCAPFVVCQSSYNLLNRLIEAEVVPSCLNYGMGIVAYEPLAQGVLTGKYRPGEPVTSGTRAWQNPSPNLAHYMSDANLAAVQKLTEWASDHGHSAVDLAMAWVAAQPGVCSVLVGAISTEQLDANVKGAEWNLSSDQLEEVTKIAEAASPAI